MGLILPKMKNSKILRSTFLEYWRCTLIPNFIFLAPLVWPVARIKCRKMKNCQMTNFMKIGLKIKISNKYFWTNYNFWLLNSIRKMNFLSQKMTVQALVIFNKDYIAKN